MRVLTVTHSLSRQAGGISVCVRRLCQCMHGQGVDTRVLGLHDSDTERDLPAWAPLVPDVFSCKPPTALGYAPGLRHTLAAYADTESILHLHGLWKLTSRDVLSVSRRAGVPRVISPHGMLDAWALEQSRVRKGLARLLYEGVNLREASCLHALNRSELEQIRSFGLRAPVAVIPNGVDLPGPEPVAPLDDRLAVTDAKVLLFLARVHPKKGLLPLVRAWKDVQARRDNWVLVIAGPGEAGHDRDVAGLVRELGLEASVRLVGPQYDEAKDAWLRRADATILPSFSEGFPVAVLEGMAYALPVIMTPQCNFPEAVAAGAAICAEATTIGLAEALVRLFAMGREERQAMGERGRALVGASYTWSHAAEKMVSVYGWLLAAEEKPDCVVMA